MFRCLTREKVSLLPQSMSSYALFSSHGTKSFYLRVSERFDTLRGKPKLKLGESAWTSFASGPTKRCNYRGGT